MKFNDSGEAVLLFSQIIKMKKSTNWSRDEAILLLDTYFKLRGTAFNKSSVMVQNLSCQLRALRPTVSNSSKTYRNLNGVFMTLMNVRSLDATHQGTGLASASETLKLAWRDFGEDELLLGKVAANIRYELKIGSSLEEKSAHTNVGSTFEGKLLSEVHLRRERNTTIVEEAKAAFLQSGRLRCEACAFDFEKAYGTRGAGFIEAHHRIPLSHSELVGRLVKISDFVMLCSNCHRMIHRCRPWLTVEELTQLINR